MDYLSYSYIVQFVPQFSFSLKKQIRNPEKVYVIDLGLFNENSTVFTPELGRKLENTVYLHLRRKYSEIYYFQDKGECDFVVFKKNKIQHIIQVCYNLTSENIDREINGLLQAMEFFNVKNGQIVTYDQNELITRGDKKIQCITVEDFLEDKPSKP
jgi:predicted AAA+ superfamily ATPase